MEDIRKDRFYMDLLKNRESELFQNDFWLYGADLKTVIRVVTDVEEINKKQEEMQVQIGTIYKEPYSKLIKDLVIFPNGEYGTHIRAVEEERSYEQSNVVILPIFNNQIVLVNYFRHAPRTFLWELPRGIGCQEKKVESKEKALKKLKEELGVVLTKDNLVFLGEINPDSCIFERTVTVYAAVFSGDTYNVPKHKAGIGNIRKFSRIELLDRIADGQIKDMFTISTIMLACAKRVL